jgi:transposase
MNPLWQSSQRLILLPELKLINQWQQDKFRSHYRCFKESRFEVCPKCAVPSYSVHDKRWVRVHDQPMRGIGIYIHICKRRFRCPSCKKVFTEPVSGVRKGFKTTERYRKGLRWACENFKNLKRVRRAYACSSWLTQKVFYEQLEIKHREKMNDPISYADSEKVKEMKDIKVIELSTEEPGIRKLRYEVKRFRTLCCSLL